MKTSEPLLNGLVDYRYVETSFAHSTVMHITYFASNIKIIKMKGDVLKNCNFMWHHLIYYGNGFNPGVFKFPLNVYSS